MLAEPYRTYDAVKNKTNQLNIDDDIDSLYMTYETPVIERVNTMKRKNIENDSQNESPILNKKQRRMDKIIQKMI